MGFTAQQIMDLSKGAVAITMFSSIIGGHLTASYFLYTPSNSTLEIYAQIITWVVAANLFYFIACGAILLLAIVERRLLLRASLFMLINIPLSIGYLAIVMSSRF